MGLLIVSAAVIGFTHSLSPAHWVPIVLIGKKRQWGFLELLGASTFVAVIHIVVSILVGTFVGFVAQETLHGIFEAVLGWIILVYGAGYSFWIYKTHRHCGHHEHHHQHDASHPKPSSRKTPFIFLVTLGFVPCMAAFPVLSASFAYGLQAHLLAVAAFGLGVWVALVGSTALLHLGFKKIHHPWFEHHGELVSGLILFGVGLILVFRHFFE